MLLACAVLGVLGLTPSVGPSPGMFCREAYCSEVSMRFCGDLHGSACDNMQLACAALACVAVAVQGFAHPPGCSAERPTAQR
jgi:hypothetical protein